MKILAIECSSLSAGVAVTEDSKVLGESFVNVGLTHSQTLMPMVEGVLKSTATDIQNIDVLSVSAGPGSFTGVRIGVSALKGLAYSHDKPCYSVSSLESIAYPFKSFDGVVCSVMDARCNQVYTAFFENGKRISDDDAVLIDDLKEKIVDLNKRVILAGDAVNLVYNKLKDEIDNIFLPDSQMQYAHASSVALLTFEKLSSGEKTVNAKELLPMYLRLPQAQRELNNKKTKGE